MTGPAARGDDDDPVAQFSDPDLRHGYAEYPAPQGQYGGGPPYPPEGRAAARQGPRRLLPWIIAAIVVAAAAAVVVSLVH